MSHRLYHEDSYQTTFDARVVERLVWGGHPAVVLDRTAFYPTGGGQPHDVGLLRAAGTVGSIPVLEVVERPEDGAVCHLLAAPLEVDQVEGQVDWDRRFDLMQQHTGQHVLSAVFVEELDANTVGFHLSGDYATIDLDRAPLSPEALATVEGKANAILFENRPVRAQFVPDEEVAGLPLRKPLAHEGPVRIVDIPGIDCSACGGTHVRSTGEVGLIKVTRSERRSGQTRIEFLCGRRALSDYQAKNALVMDLAREFTVGHWELPEMVRRLADDLKEVRRELRDTRDSLLDAEATVIWQQATEVGQLRIVRAHLPGRSSEDLKHLAQRLTEHPETVALLAAGGLGTEKGHFTFARSQDVDVHMGALLRVACEVIGGRGGGRPDFAQGGGPQGERVVQGLDIAFESLRSAVPQTRALGPHGLLETE